MVQTEISQLSGECAEWRQILRGYREEFGDCKKALEEICRTSGMTKEQLLEVEHYQNQFHIQLINIHDLKQSIKAHEKRILLEGDHVSEKTFSLHEKLLSEFLGQEAILQELRVDFKNFISRISC